MFFFFFFFKVSIKSLPQEWLWCETWCDDESKSKAKTIDLCNNPKTKEPKLTSARRIVDEWETYDKELRSFLESLKSEEEKADQYSASVVHPIDHHQEL